MYATILNGAPLPPLILVGSATVVAPRGEDVLLVLPTGHEVAHRVSRPTQRRPDVPVPSYAPAEAQEIGRVQPSSRPRRLRPSR